MIMNDSISIGTVNSGNTMINATGSTISGSAVVNVYGDQLGLLRTRLDELMAAIDAVTVPTSVSEAAELARAEAAKQSPEPGRLRKLMNTVVAGAQNVAAVTQAALNVVAIIAMIEKAAH
jgi:hypothetical protein